ncbi:hypothetical protein [Nesterenkonia pannonica]|uniref:hypothetical protein n=1 Tax=Nesterenkonia pannonica TaxID=1548602 RepID=UPI0021648266|nr:hypothetical protein [Nesterenkonia pannonica]
MRRTARRLHQGQYQHGAREDSEESCRSASAPEPGADVQQCREGDEGGEHSQRRGRGGEPDHGGEQHGRTHSWCRQQKQAECDETTAPLLLIWDA